MKTYGTKQILKTQLLVACIYSIQKCFDKPIKPYSPIFALWTVLERQINPDAANS
jgi:hypothetical protein